MSVVPDEVVDSMVQVCLCVDCVYVDANGYDDSVSKDWPGFLEEWDGWLFGRIDADEYTDGEHFSTAACDGCGSGLAGSRYDYLAVPMNTKGDGR